MAQTEVFPIINKKHQVELRDSKGRYHGTLPTKGVQEVYNTPSGPVVKDEKGHYVLWSSKNKRRIGIIPTN
jgi:hypothetical protein